MWRSRNSPVILSFRSLVVHIIHRLIDENGIVGHTACLLSTQAPHQPTTVRLSRVYPSGYAVVAGSVLRAVGQSVLVVSRSFRLHMVLVHYSWELRVGCGCPGRSIFTSYPTCGASNAASVHLLVFRLGSRLVRRCPTWVREMNSPRVRMNRYIGRSGPSRFSISSVLYAVQCAVQPLLWNCSIMSLLLNAHYR